MKGMSLEAWRDHVKRGHIPYSRECRTCLREMGIDAHHRRQKGCGAAYTLSADIVGPFVEGYDTALKGKAKYALVATIAVPIFPGMMTEDDAAYEPTDTEEADPGVPAEALVDLPLVDVEPGEVEWATDEEVARLNAQVLSERLKPSEGKLMNLTFVEVVTSRRGGDVALALSLIYARLRAYGIPVLRLHTDRAKEFLSESVRTWAASRSIWQTDGRR